MNLKTVDWKFLRWASLVFAPVLGLLFLFRDTVREEVLNPILYLFWLGELILRSVDQRILWGGLWLLLLLAGARLMLPERKPSATGFGPSRLGPEPGRAQFWANQLRNAERNDFFYQDARLALKQLALNALAQREGISQEEIATAIQRGEVQVPAEIRILWEEFLPDLAADRQGWVDRLSRFLSQIRIGPKIFGFKAERTDVDLRWKGVVQYLEEQMNSGGFS